LQRAVPTADDTSLHERFMTTAHDRGRGLEWTGERYVPELPGNIRLEHLHRYLLARELVKDRRVLDIACGEGYGSDLLATAAAQVVGVDIAPDALQHARRRYRRPHLRFVAGSCTAIPIAARSVDVVVSFETLEHLNQHDEMMREVRRVLTPNGLLIISSPDRREYSDIPGYQNPFHVRELYRDEFEALLASHFRAVSLVGQRVRAGSIVEPLDATAATAFLGFAAAEGSGQTIDGLQAPLYLIGLASDGELPRVQTGILDGGEFVWASDHTETIRGVVERHRSELEQLAALRAVEESEVSALRAELDRQAALAASLAAGKEMAEERSASFEEEVGRRGRRIDELGAELTQLKEISDAAHQALQETTDELAQLKGTSDAAHQALQETRDELAQLKGTSDAAHQALQETRDELAQLKGTSDAAHQALQETSDALHRANAAVVDLQTGRAALEARLRAIENSRSWRLTAPLRRILGVARGAAPDTSTGVASSSVPAHDRTQPETSPIEPVPPLQPTAEEPAASAPSAPPDADPHLAPGPSQAVSSSPLRSERPSIVVVSHDAHFYGAQRLALFLVRTLAREMGYDVEVLLCGGGPLVQQFAEAGRVHDFYSAASTPERQSAVILGLYERGARIAICNTSCVGDVVHTLKSAGFSVVSLIHELPGLIGQYGLENSIATISREADKVVFAADVVRDRFVELTGLSLDKAIVRPQGLLIRNRYTNGAEARRELRERLGVGEHTKIVLAIGSAHRRKGPDLFVEAGLSVIKTRTDVVFVWVGHTDGDGFDEASGRVSLAGAQRHFIFPGVIEDSDVFFAGADVYLMTSREDPFPSVVLHALDAELPVIGFDNAGGFVELLRRGCGILVPYLDTSAMAAATLSLLADPAAAQGMIATGKEIVSREFEFARYVHDLVKLAQGPRVSVILPNYNYAHHLPARLRSILTQTYRPHEIVFLDDCSTDNSVAVAENLLGQGGIPFRIITNDRNLGVYRQWLRGITEAAGDLVWIAEADDDCSPQLLETLVATFKQPGVVLAYCQSRQVDDAGQEIAPDYLGWTEDLHRTKWRERYVRRGIDEIRDSLAVKNTIPNVSAVLMKKPDLAAIESELLTLRNAGDWLVYVHLLEKGDIAFVPEPLNYHRRHSGSVTIGHGGLNLMRETLLVQRRILARHQVSADVECRRDAHLQATYEYLGLNIDGPASYKDHEALRALTGVAG
jgi:glycosyltransferase involved in cell wall biosynthesis/SAM-dependent methyltransferase